MAKRIFDLLFALLVLPVIIPVLILAAICVWLEDHRSPIYLSARVGINGRAFRLLKIRTMVVNADHSRIDTTVLDDPRVTKVGDVLRKWKIDELPQFLNVLSGEMSIVGPRPNVEREVRSYMGMESRLLLVKPGITDLASIAFSNLAEALGHSDDPNADYKDLVRPWKSRLGLLYVQKASLWVDFKIILLTPVAILRRKWAMKGFERLLHNMGADQDLISIAVGRTPLRWSLSVRRASK